MKDHTLIQLCKQVISKFKDYLQKASIPIFETEDGELFTYCPVCSGKTKILDNSSWCCPECNHQGDVIAYAKAFYRLESDEKALQDICRRLNMKMPILCTTTGSMLLQAGFPEQEEIVEGMLTPGLYILAGAPKIGKSWLALDMAVSISMGKSIWERKTIQSAVLYLSLEDPGPRLQKRLHKLYGSDAEGLDNLHIATEAELLGCGLEEQLTAFLNCHPTVKTVIIDTLGKAKGMASSKYNYSEDYHLAAAFKNIAMRFNVAVVLIHHTRKQEATDIMNMISGTNGLFGCADGGMVMTRPDRMKAEAVLDVSGKDFPDERMMLCQNPVTMRWELCENLCSKSEKEEEVVTAVLNLMEDNEVWEGTATELLDQLMAINPRIRTAPNALIRKLNMISEILKKRESIEFTNGREGNEKIKVLERISNT